MLAHSSTEFNFWSAWYCQLGITWFCIDIMSGDIHRSSNSVDLFDNCWRLYNGICM